MQYGSQARKWRIVPKERTARTKPYPRVAGERAAALRPGAVRAEGAPALLDFPHVSGLETLRAFDDLEFHVVALGKRAEALRHDRRVVNEHVLAALLRDEAEPLRVVEPLDRALRHCHNLMKMGARRLRTTPALVAEA